MDLLIELIKGILSRILLLACVFGSLMLLAFCAVGLPPSEREQKIADCEWIAEVDVQIAGYDLRIPASGVHLIAYPSHSGYWGELLSPESHWTTGQSGPTFCQREDGPSEDPIAVWWTGDGAKAAVGGLEGATTDGWYSVVVGTVGRNSSRFLDEPRVYDTSLSSEIFMKRLDDVSRPRDERIYETVGLVDGKHWIGAICKPLELPTPRKSCTVHIRRVSDGMLIELSWDSRTDWPEEGQPVPDEFLSMIPLLDGVLTRFAVP